MLIRKRTHRIVAWVDEQTYNIINNYVAVRKADKSEYLGELIWRGIKDRNDDYKKKLFEKMDEKEILEKRIREFKKIHVHEDAVKLMNDRQYKDLMIIKKNDYKDTYAAMELRDMLVFMGVDSWGRFTEILLDAIKDGEIWIEGDKVVRRKTSLKAQRAQKKAGFIKKIDRWCQIGGEEDDGSDINEI